MSTESSNPDTTREHLGKAAYEADLAWYEGGSSGFTSWEQQRHTTRERYCKIAEAVVLAYEKNGGESHVQ